MFFEFDLNTWVGSLVVLLFMGGIVTGFSAVLTALMCLTWGPESEFETHPEAGPVTTLRKAA